MKKQFTPKAQNVLNNCLNISSELGHTYIGSEHLLLALAKEEKSISKRILDDKGLSYSSIEDSVKSVSGTGEKTFLCPSDITPRLKKIISDSQNVASVDRSIGTEHLLFTLLEQKDSVAYKILQGKGVNISELKSSVSRYTSNAEAYHRQENEKAKKAVNNSAISQYPALSQYGKDLTEIASDLDPIIGRDNETERVIQILSRRTKNNPALIGEPGVGKTAVVEGLAKRIAQGKVPEELTSKHIVSLDISSMIAGAKYRGEFEERMKNVMSELKKASDIILFIDELHMIVGADSAEGALDAANIIKPALSRGELRLIGATTFDEYRKHIEKDAALERRFQPVYIDEPSVEDTIKIIKGLRTKYESHHKLKITDDAIIAASELSSRYISDRYLPDKAIDLIDETASKKRIDAYTMPPYLKAAEDKIKDAEKCKENAITSQSFEDAARIRDDELKLKSEYDELYTNWKRNINSDALSITSDDIAQTVCRWTGIPVANLKQDEGQKLRELEAELSKKIVGQKAAIKAVCDAVKRGRSGLKPDDKPIGSFIFIGPTGVGKTQLSKVLALSLFGSENSIIRLDMSEYKESHSISKLIGSPPGYVGYDEGGQLCEKVRRKPYSLILFDEIEKAHPDIFNLLLQILDEGKLTDSRGRAVNFKNTIIIMTSNVGARDINGKKALGFSDHSYSEQNNEYDYTRELKNVFSPEFLNRIDSVVHFSALSDDDLKVISKHMIDDLRKRLSKMNIHLKVDDAVYDHIIKCDKEKSYGARPLRRFIINRIETPITDLLIDKKVNSGQILQISVKGDNLDISVADELNNASVHIIK